MGGFAAIDELRAERVCADSVQGEETLTFRKCTDNGSECEVKKRCVGTVCQCSVRCVSVHVTTAETLGRERMCANSGRTHGDNVQGMHRQRERVHVEHLKVHETIYLFSFSRKTRYTNQPRYTSAGS